MIKGEKEGGAPHLKSQVHWNPYFTRREVGVGKVARHLCL